MPRIRRWPRPSPRAGPAPDAPGPGRVPALLPLLHGEQGAAHRRGHPPHERAARRGPRHGGRPDLSRLPHRRGAGRPPTPARLQAATGLGYRAGAAGGHRRGNWWRGGQAGCAACGDVPYPRRTPRWWRLRGVGPKVADCVCLFSLDHTEAVPVDTHIWQMAQQLWGRDHSGVPLAARREAARPGADGRRPTAAWATCSAPATAPWPATRRSGCSTTTSGATGAAPARCSKRPPDKYAQQPLIVCARTTGTRGDPRVARTQGRPTGACCP